MNKSHLTGNPDDLSSALTNVNPEPDHVRESVDLNELFGRVSAKIADKYPVTKGVLVIRQQSSGRLAAISTWEHGHVHDGLTITLPVESSLFEKVIAGGKTHIEKSAGSFSGNFFERKLLTADTAGSIILKPLFLADRLVGLVGYCSEAADGFSETAIQSFDEIVAVLSPHLDRKQAES